MKTVAWNIKSPCRDCKTRHLKCHGSCEEYRHFQEAVEKYKKATQAEYTAAISRHLMKKDRKWTPK